MNTLAVEDEIREQKSLFGVITLEADEDMQLEELKQPKSLFDVEPEMTENENGEPEMQTLGLCEEFDRGKGFWRRQFQAEPTRRQKQWDWAYGVILPLVCFFFDPFVFRFWDGHGGMLASYKPFAYSGSAVAIILMAAWLLWKEKLGGFGSLFAGVFFAAAPISLAIGVILLPFSVVGLMALVGALGFTPLFAGVIFLRNGVRALRAAEPHLPRIKLAYASILGTLWALAIPYALQMEVNRSFKLIEHGSPETIYMQGLKLRALAPLVDADQLRNAYLAAPPGSKEDQAIKELYDQLGGSDNKGHLFF